MWAAAGKRGLASRTSLINASGTRVNADVVVLGVLKICIIFT